MKKLISALIVISMLCMALVAVVPAYAAEETTVDTSDLSELVKELEAYYAEDYTAETWAPLQEKLAAAKTVLANTAATQTEVDAAFDALDMAKKALKTPKVTREMLAEKIAAAKALVEAEYTEATWKKLALALSEAETIYDSNTSIASKLEPKFNALRDALRQMKYEPGPLQAVINKAAALDEMSTYAKKSGKTEDYTDATLVPFREALKKARENVKKNDLELFNASIAELEAAIEALVPHPAPTDMINKCKELMELAKVLIPEQWPDAAWGMVDMKMKQVEDAPKNPLVSTYVKAATELETALKNLTNEDKTSKEELPQPPKVDTSLVDGLIQWCDENLVEGDYSADSWAALKAAYDHAKEVSADPKTAERVMDAWEKLKAAKDKLVPVDPALKATGNAANTATDPATNGGTEEAGCGGVVGTTAVVLTAVLGLGAAIVAKKKD